MKNLLSTFLLLSVCSAVSLAQESASLAHEPDSLRILRNKLTLDSLADLFTYEDSLAIFEMIDSVLKSEPLKETAQLAVRIGYNSNIVADSRSLGIDKFGLAPGISYYHTSGAYADVTTYWSQEYTPSSYLTMASVGYFHEFTKHYSILAEYSHYFYHESGDSTVYVPYTNNIGLTNYFDFKPFIFRLDYYLYFGDKIGHRIMPGMGLNLVKRKWLGIQRIAFYPNASVLFGSEQITGYEFYDNLLFRYRLGLPLVYETLHTEFGVMNYSFSAPISVIHGNWSFLLNYTYNIPKSLPGEDLTLQDGGYLSFSVTRFFGL